MKRSQVARDRTIATFGARARQLARTKTAEALLRACVASLEGYRQNEHGEGCGQMCDAEKAAREFLGLHEPQECSGADKG